MARKQKLMTKQIEKLIDKYPYLSQDGKGLDAKILVKYFLPCSAATWYITEGEKTENGDYILYGWCNLGYGFEFGSVMFSELKSLKKKFLYSYVYIERDTMINNGKDTLRDMCKYDLQLKVDLNFLNS